MKTPQGPQQVKFTIIKSCLARFSGIFAVGTPSNIHGTAISYRCAKFSAFVNSVTILTLRDPTSITFSHSRKNFDPVKLNGQDLELVQQVKILRLQISSDIMWNSHWLCVVICGTYLRSQRK